MTPPHVQLGSSYDLAREDEALLAAVDVSSLDKQEGYDVSLLALQPRDVRPSPSSSPPDRLQEGYDVSLLALQPRDVRPSPSSSPPADPRASFHFHGSSSRPDTLRDPSVAYASVVPSTAPSTRDDESAPLDPSSTSRPSSDTARRFHRRSTVPPLSAPNPRRAAQAYSERARAAERHRRGDGDGGGSLEKGGSAAAGGGAARGRRAFKQRRGLVLALALVVLLVCGGIGAGLGVSLGGGRSGGGEKDDGLAVAAAATPTAGGSSSRDVGLEM
ncbi:hypothetical protein JCM3775_000299 [Rhodotorula graminis]